MDDEVALLGSFSPSPRHHRSHNALHTPSTQKKRLPSSSYSGSKGSGSRGLSGSNGASIDEEEEILTEHKIQQRQKQIQYGFNTIGYQNMVRLLESDPRLSKGGVLPLQPPAANVKTSKRAWDVLARKWRRSLHLFDDVFIDSADKETTTLEAVVEEQRKKWVSPKYAHLPKEARVPLSRDALLAARFHPSVPKRLPVEECMKPILRSLDCYEDLNRVVPDTASSLIKGNTGVSPTDAGIKMFIAPSAEAALFNHFAGDATRSPSPDMAVTPSTIAQMRSTSPLYGTSTASSPHPQHALQRSTSPTAVAPPTHTNLAVFGSRGVEKMDVMPCGHSDGRYCQPTARSPSVPLHHEAPQPHTSRLSPLATPYQPFSRPTLNFSPSTEDYTLGMSGQDPTASTLQVLSSSRSRGRHSSPTSTPSYAPPPPLGRPPASPVVAGLPPASMVA
eukprot:CAMPEP_0176414692 /NCGR_PEP_ID=MMETSP0127-20121128/5398_1 /TAXON_ID=938130 /ORGANISM="Platyophrya macrostoma, Strain WH" /LENGTH=446 /DNA_ID=CAMNT_0017794617 /DNA_START=51 /DNA_END=1391 /DNA_ORIENTATION=+